MCNQFMIGQPRHLTSEWGPCMTYLVALRGCIGGKCGSKQEETNFLQFKSIITVKKSCKVIQLDMKS